jgi:hypothetical protein
MVDDFANCLFIGSGAITVTVNVAITLTVAIGVTFAVAVARCDASG